MIPSQDGTDDFRRAKDPSVRAPTHEDGIPGVAGSRQAGRADRVSPRTADLGSVTGVRARGGRPARAGQDRQRCLPGGRTRPGPSGQAPAWSVRFQLYRDQGRVRLLTSGGHSRDHGSPGPSPLSRPEAAYAAEARHRRPAPGRGEPARPRSRSSDRRAPARPRCAIAAAAETTVARPRGRDEVAAGLGGRQHPDPQLPGCRGPRLPDRRGEPIGRPQRLLLRGPPPMSPALP